MFKPQEPWNLVETEFKDEKPKETDEQLRDNRKKDAKFLFFIQQALGDSVFPLITAGTTSKQEWDILKQEYLGYTKVITVKLQTFS